MSALWKKILNYKGQLVNITMSLVVCQQRFFVKFFVCIRTEELHADPLLLTVSR